MPFFLPGHQLQKKLMLRPTAVPTENLPPEITNASFIDRPDSPDDFNTSEENSSYSTSLNQSDSNTNPILPINEFTDDHGQLINDNLANHFNYHYTATTPAPVNNSSSTLLTSYEPISLETVPYTELIKVLIDFLCNWQFYLLIFSTRRNIQSTMDQKSTRLHWPVFFGRRKVRTTIQVTQSRTQLATWTIKKYSLDPYSF
jgi:hypothetical protein